MILTKLQNQSKLYAQMAGLLYLIIAVVGGLSIAYMPSQIVVDGDAGATFQNLIEHQILFKWGIAGDIIVLVLETLLTVMLYQLFKSYSRTGMAIATYSRLAMAIIMGMNLINYLIPSILITQADFLTVFSEEQLASLSFIFFKAHKYGELCWQIFFSIHLFSLGYVLRKSDVFPNWLGVIMLIGGVGYGGDSFIQLTLIHSEMLTMLFSILLFVAVVAELWFAFWLLIRGAKNTDMA